MRQQKKYKQACGLTFVTILLVVACVARPFTPSSPSAEIKGVLIDSTSGQPVDEANLQLWVITGQANGVDIAAGKQPVAETETDNAGTFSFRNVPPNRYMIYGSYETNSMTRTLRILMPDRASNVIEVRAEETVDVGTIQNCRHTVCSPWQP